MKEIVWVYGPSAAGKETFVRLACSPEGKRLRERFGWTGKNVVPCLESFEWVGKKRIKNDPIVAKRNQLIQTVLRIVTQADVVFVKGQGVDLLADRPNQLLVAEPMLRHRVMYLRVTVAELMSRLADKPWWDGSDSPEDILKWVDYEVSMLQKLDPKINIVAIDSSSNKNYEIVDLPERLRDRSTYSS